jgi:hypothetical protein
VRAVESAGRGFDADGRPKRLFERHKFHRFTGGRSRPARSANPPGAIRCRWQRHQRQLGQAERRDRHRRSRCRVHGHQLGAFQIMGEWWDALGYQSPFAMAFACVASEAAHLDMLARYIEHFRLKPALAALTSNPATCRAFAAAYNGPGYRVNRYDEKLAARMAA